MADIFNLGTPTGAIADNDLGATGGRSGTDLDTGKLRRRFNFGDRVSELMISQDPFFRFVSKAAKQSTDDPAFKFTEKRASWHKRYGYVEAHGSAFATAASAAVTAQEAVTDTVYLKIGTDYSNKGNMQNVLGQTIVHDIGDADTQPQFFLPGQVIKVPVSATHNGAVADYQLVKITDVDLSLSGYAKLTGTCIKGFTSGYFYNLPGTVDAGSTAAGDVAANNESLEAGRVYVVGSAYAEGSGYPETWKDQPYGTGYGQTQIWKTSMAMTNSMRATALKYEQNEWSRIWREKLVEHKWDIEQSLLFGSQYTDADGVQYTQGAVDFALNFGNKFSLDIATKTADDFLDDMSGYLDPRYNNGKGTIFFCNTEVYNWLHKLGGYFKNNIEISSNYRADMAITGKKKVFGVDITTISTPYGDMNVARNIHLDGTNVKLLGLNMSHCKYRPLAGNGINRDTSVYVGVQTLENSGIDRRVDLILTEAGMQWEMPESHAVWTA